MRSEEVLLKLIKLFTLYLEELSEIPERSPFVLGEMTAFVECLEIVSEWESAAAHGLSFIPAQKFGV